MENIEEKIMHKSHSQSKQVRIIGRSQNSCHTIKAVEIKPKSKFFTSNKSRLRISEEKVNSIDSTPIRNRCKRNENFENPVLSNYSSPLNILGSKDSKKRTTSKGPKQEKPRKKSKKREIIENPVKTSENHLELTKPKQKDREFGRRCSAELVKSLVNPKQKFVSNPSTKDQCLDLHEHARPETADIKKLKKIENTQPKKPLKKINQEKPTIINKKATDSNLQAYIKESRRKKSREKSVKKHHDEQKERERILALISLDKQRKLSKSKKKNNKGKIIKEKFVGFKTMRKKKSKFDIEDKSQSKNRRKTPKIENSIQSSSSSESFLSTELRTERDDWINTWNREYKGPASEFVEEFKVKLQKNSVKIPKIQEISEKLTETSKKSSSVFSDFGETMSRPINGLLGSLGSSIKPNVPPLSLSLLKNEEFTSEDESGYIINKNSEISVLDSNQSSESEDYSKSESENNTKWIIDVNSVKSMNTEMSKEAENLKKLVPAFKNINIKKIKKQSFDESLDGSVNLNELVSLKSPRKNFNVGQNNLKKESFQDKSEENFKNKLEPEDQKLKDLELNGESSEESLGNSGDYSENYHGYSSSCEQYDEDHSEEKSDYYAGSNMKERMKEITELIENKEELIKNQENSDYNKSLVGQKKGFIEVIFKKNSESSELKNPKVSNEPEEENIGEFKGSGKNILANQLSKGLVGNKIENNPQKATPIVQITKKIVEDNLAKQLSRPTLIPSPKEPLKPSTKSEENGMSLKIKEADLNTENLSNRSNEKNKILKIDQEKVEKHPEKSLKITQNAEKISIFPKKLSSQSLEKSNTLPQTPEKQRISLQIQEKVEIISINPKKKIISNEPIAFNPEPDNSNLAKKSMTKKLNPIITKTPGQVVKKIISLDDPEHSIQPISDEKFLIETPTSSENLFTPIENPKVTKIKASFIPEFTKIEEFKYEDRISENSIQGYDMLQTSLIMPSEYKSIDVTTESVSPLSVKSPKNGSFGSLGKGLSEEKSIDRGKISPKEYEKNEKFLTAFKEPQTKAGTSKRIFSSKFLENLGELSSDRSKKFSDSAKSLINYAKAIEKTGENTESSTQMDEVTGFRLENLNEKAKVYDIPEKLELSENELEKLEMPGKKLASLENSVKISEKTSLLKENPLKTSEPKQEKPKKVDKNQDGLNNIFENPEKAQSQLLKPDKIPKTSEEPSFIPTVTPILLNSTKPDSVSNFTSDLFKSYNPFTDSSSSDINLSKSYESSPTISPTPSSLPSLMNEDWSVELSSLINSEISNFLRIISFKDSEKEVDPSLDYIMEYLNTMANELKENEFEVLEAINTPVYQEPLSRLATFQDPKTPILSKFPTLELILPPDLCSELKVRFESLELPSRQIYLQMLFDCVNEALNYIRPFGVTGIPDPWSTHPRILFGEAELENVFNRIVNYIVKWGSSRSGTYHCPETSGDDDRLTSVREEKMSSLLCLDIKDEESNWTYYEEEETQTKILVGNSIFTSLIDEILIIITN